MRRETSCPRDSNVLLLQYRDSEGFTDNGSFFHGCQKILLTDGRSAPIYGLWMARFSRLDVRPCGLVQFILVGENGRLVCMMEAEGAI